MNSTGYNFRGADFHIPRFHSVTYGKHSLRYLGPKLWNSLPSNLRNLPALQSFKRQIRLRQSFRGTQREYSSNPLERSIVKRILVFKR